MAEMSFLSARGSAPPVSLSHAIEQGLAPDGGLYIPTRLPQVDARNLAAASSLAEIARVNLAAFFEGDRLQPLLGEIAAAALQIAAPTTSIEACRDPLFVLELYHGPTAAFKDFGARFLAESLQRLEAAGALAALDDIGGYFGRYRRRGGSRFSPPALGTRGDSVPEGIGESATGAAIDLLGRQCAVAAHRRYLR